ncbi:hypothetical protein GCM10009838_26690 [Catenulispora subtropica]|uniref:Uncharacterized protein n=1 Tax=Catenulispora subtropica TaxID=450798 RepID=A0ABP5CUL1_9ACTN
MRKGLASFSDWEKPTLAVLRSTVGYPTDEAVQPAAEDDGWLLAATAAGPEEPVAATGLDSDFEQAVARALTATAAAARRRKRLRDTADYPILRRVR